MQISQQPQQLLRDGGRNVWRPNVCVITKLARSGDIIASQGIEQTVHSEGGTSKRRNRESEHGKHRGTIAAQVRGVNRVVVVAFIHLAFPPGTYSRWLETHIVWQGAHVAKAPAFGS